MEAFSAIFIGASEFPKYQEFDSPSFRRSKCDFEDYLRGDRPRGLGIRSSAVLDLFGSSLSPPEQMIEIADFLERVKNENPNAIRNLVIYYVGHGYFGDNNRDYYLALKQYDARHRESYGINMSAFSGNAIKSLSKHFRMVYILDCCFAGEAIKQMQGDSASVAKLAANAIDTYSAAANDRTPKFGSAVLCAASKDDVAIAPKTLQRTVFSDALLDVLTHGDAELGSMLTLEEVKDLVWKRIVEKHQEHPEYRVRPELHSPDQRDGNIAQHLPLFSNLGVIRRDEAQAIVALDTSLKVPTLHPWNFLGLVRELKYQLSPSGVFNLDYHPAANHDDGLASEIYLLRLFIQKLVFAASKMAPHAIGSANAWVCHKMKEVDGARRLPRFLRSGEREGHFRVDQLVTKLDGVVRYRTNEVSYGDDCFELLSSAAQAIVRGQLQFVDVPDTNGYQSEAEIKSGITHILGIPLYRVEDLGTEMEGVPMAVTVDFDFRGQALSALHRKEIESNGVQLMEIFARFKSLWGGTRSLQIPHS